MDPLLTVQITHDYYRNTYCRDIKMRPSSVTAVLLKKWGIILKQVGESYVLLCDTLVEKNTKVQAFIPASPVSMTFVLYTTDTYFDNITDLPLDPADQVFYFSNHSANAGGNMLLLHEGRKAAASDKIALRPLMFTHAVPPAAVETTVTVVDRKNNSVLSQTLPSSTAACFIDLTAAGEGEYTVKVDDRPVLQFYALGTERGRVLGVIEIFIDDEVEEHFRLLDTGGAPVNPRYGIRFGSRATTWVYLVQGNYPSRYKDMIITGANTSFTGPKKITLSNGDKAVAFYSEDPIPLAERPLHYFQLKENDSNVLMDMLPAAGPALIKSSDDGRILSEIFVHL
jgi:hypothetical protein